MPEEPSREVRSAPVSVSYALPSERPFWAFLGGSAAILALTVIGYGAAFRPEPAPKVVEIELNDINAVPGEPPPKGDSAEAPPEPTPQAEPEPTPEPEPEPTPEPPPPEEKPEFIKPEIVPTPPPPKPKPAVTRPPQPSPRPLTPPAPATQPRAAGSPGVTRGTASGVAGGRGGSKGDFLSTPKPQYDLTALQRHYQGSGEVLITYSGGSIVSVSMTRSTGVPYLDSKTTAHVKSNYRVKPGASGKATFNITWNLPR